MRQLFRRDSPTIRQVTMGPCGGSNSATIVCTDEHPFWVPATGWVPASCLQPDQQLVTFDNAGSWRINASVPMVTDTPVFNFEVLESHNYCVGRVGVLVHNASHERGAWSLDQAATWKERLDVTNSPGCSRREFALSLFPASANPDGQLKQAEIQSVLELAAIQKETHLRANEPGANAPLALSTQKACEMARAEYSYLNDLAAQRERLSVPAGEHYQSFAAMIYPETKHPADKLAAELYRLNVRIGAYSEKLGRGPGPRLDNAQVLPRLPAEHERIGDLAVAKHAYLEELLAQRDGLRGDPRGEHSGYGVDMEVLSKWHFPDAEDPLAAWASKDQRLLVLISKMKREIGPAQPKGLSGVDPSLRAHFDRWENETLTEYSLLNDLEGQRLEWTAPAGSNVGEFAAKRFPHHPDPEKALHEHLAQLNVMMSAYTRNLGGIEPGLRVNEFNPVNLPPSYHRIGMLALEHHRKSQGWKAGLARDLGGTPGRDRSQLDHERMTAIASSQDPFDDPLPAVADLWSGGHRSDSSKEMIDKYRDFWTHRSSVAEYFDDRRWFYEALIKHFSAK